MIVMAYLGIGAFIAWRWRRHFNEREYWAVASIIVLLWGPILATLLAYAAIDYVRIAWRKR